MQIGMSFQCIQCHKLSVTDLARKGWMFFFEVYIQKRQFNKSLLARDTSVIVYFFWCNMFPDSKCGGFHTANNCPFFAGRRFCDG